jgi:hypothetical protein
MKSSVAANPIRCLQVRATADHLMSDAT